VLEVEPKIFDALSEVKQQKLTDTGIVKIVPHYTRDFRGRVGREDVLKSLPRSRVIGSKFPASGNRQRTALLTCQLELAQIGAVPNFARCEADGQPAKSSA
jgi:hypothetical protein